MNETLQRFWDEVRVQCPGTEILLSLEEKLQLFPRMLSQGI